MSLHHLYNLAPQLTGDRIGTLPILILYLTDGCNSRCITCDIWRSPRRNMSPGLIDALIAQTGDLGVRWVVLSGGEAMQHPDWPGIAARFRAQGVRVLLLTNGLLVRRQLADVTATVDELIVSLDGGTAATYAAIRGVDAFDLVLEGIAGARAAGLPVTTRTTVQRDNFRELPQIIRAGLDADVTAISFLPVDVSSPFAFGDRLAPAEHQPPAAALTRDEVAEFGTILDQVERDYAAAFAAGRIAESPAKLRRLAAYFGGLHTGEFTAPRCNAPQIAAVIEVDGRVRPCYFLPVSGRVTPQQPLSEALNGADARDLRRAVRLGQRAECERCVCPLYKGARALWQI